MKRVLTIVVLGLLGCGFAFSGNVHIDTVRGTDNYVDNAETLYISGGNWASAGYIMILVVNIMKYKGVTYLEGKDNIIDAADYNITVDAANDSIYGYIYDVGTFAVSDSVDSLRVSISILDVGLLVETAVSPLHPVDAFSPDTIEDLTVVPWPDSVVSDSDSVMISFHWPDENDFLTGNPVASCTIKYYDQVIDSETDWENAWLLPCGMPVPQDTGVLAQYRCNMEGSLPGLHFYAIKTVDNMGYVSPLSWETGGARSVPVTMVSFAARSVASGIILTWATDSETDNLGWNVFRQADTEEPFRKINSSLIPGHGTSVTRQTYEYKDYEIPEHCTIIKYYLEQTDLNGRKTSFPVITVAYDGPVAEVRDRRETPPATLLSGNIPNPMAGYTRFWFKLPDAYMGSTQLSIFDAHGSLVREYILPVGISSIQWDGNDAQGQRVGNGVYVYMFKAGVWSASRRFLKVK